MSETIETPTDSPASTALVTITAALPSILAADKNVPYLPKGPRRKNSIPIVMPGDRFGILTCLARAEPIKGQQRIVVQCDCGSQQKIITVSSVIRAGMKSVSCGCVSRQALINRTTIHGMARTRVYSIWRGVITRITCKKHHTFPRYGGRGLDIDPRWEASFDIFYSDMGDPPTKSHSIERKDNSRGYWPDNCIWATRGEQAANTRTNVYVIVGGERVILEEARRRLRISKYGIWNRVSKAGETHQAAVDHFAQKRARQEGLPQ